MAYVDASAIFVYKKPLFQSKLDILANNDAFLKNNGWQDGTVAVFFQAAAPVGWTKVVTQNDKTLRVVSGAGGGAGGGQGLSSPITLQHTAHSIPNTGTSHNHASSFHSHLVSRIATGSNDWNIVGYAINAGASQVDGKLTGATGGQSVLSEDTETAAGTLNAADDHTHGGATINSALTDVTLQFIDVLVCSKDVTVGFTDLTTEFDHLDKIDFDPFETLADNDNFHNTRITPSSSVAVFTTGASAPVGWTKLVTNNDQALRVVSGSGGGTGGSTALSSTITLLHSHATSSEAAHSHTMNNHAHDIRQNTVTADAGTTGQRWKIIGDDTISAASFVAGTVIEGRTTSAGSGTSTSSDGSHTHAIGSSLTNTNFAFYDVIQASKDSGGAPFSFQDLTSSTAFEKLVSLQRLNNFGKNDEFLKFHIIPSGEKMVFFQTNAPLNWTKQTTQNDRILRVVAGAGGGTGGTQAASVGLTLAHTHSIANAQHFHTSFGSHTHIFAEVASGARGNTGLSSKLGLRDIPQNIATIDSVAVGTGNTQTNIKKTWDASTSITAPEDHDHGAVTGSALANVVLAFIDVIECTKD